MYFNPIWHLSLVTKHCSVMMMCHDNVCCFADSFNVLAGFVVVAMVMFSVGLVWGARRNDVICILLLRCLPLALLFGCCFWRMHAWHFVFHFICMEEQGNSAASSLFHDGKREWVPYNKNIILCAGWLCWLSGRAHVKQHDVLLFESFAWTLYNVSLWCYCCADMIMLCQFLWCSSSYSVSPREYAIWRIWYTVCCMMSKSCCPYVRGQL